MSRVTVSESEVVTVVWVTGTIVSEAQRREPLATGPGWILQSRCSHAAVTLLARDSHVIAVTVASLSLRLPCAKYIPLSREPSAAAAPTVTPAPGAAAVRV